MTIELSNITFTNEADIIPVFGIEKIVNTGIANTLAGDDTITGIGGIFGESERVNGIERASGIENIGTLNTADGNDIITGIGITYGVNISDDGTLNTGDGDDIILGIHNLSEDAIDDGDFGLGINHFGIINTGEGNDLISGISQ